MWTPADDATWLARYRAATERLKLEGSSVPTGGSAEEAVGVGEAARRSELVEAAPDTTGSGQSGGDSLEPGSVLRTKGTVEAVEAR
jgi:hypothetical protein